MQDFRALTREERRVGRGILVSVRVEENVLAAQLGNYRHQVMMQRAARFVRMRLRAAG